MMSSTRSARNGTSEIQCPDPSNVAKGVRSWDEGVFLDCIAPCAGCSTDTMPLHAVNLCSLQHDAVYIAFPNVKKRFILSDDMSSLGNKSRFREDLAHSLQE